MKTSKLNDRIVKSQTYIYIYIYIYTYTHVNIEIYRYKELKRYFESDQRQNVPPLRSTIPSVSFIIYQPTQLGLIVNERRSGNYLERSRCFSISSYEFFARYFSLTDASLTDASRCVMYPVKKVIASLSLVSLLDLSIKFFYSYISIENR